MRDIKDFLWTAISETDQNILMDIQFRIDKGELYVNNKNQIVKKITDNTSLSDAATITLEIKFIYGRVGSIKTENNVV